MATGTTKPTETVAKPGQPAQNLQEQVQTDQGSDVAKPPQVQPRQPDVQVNEAPVLNPQPGTMQGKLDPNSKPMPGTSEADLEKARQHFHDQASGHVMDRAAISFVRFSICNEQGHPVPAGAFKITVESRSGENSFEHIHEARPAPNGIITVDLLKGRRVVIEQTGDI